MPPINQAAFASAGVIALSVAVAAAIAVYESPELRRVADDLRRRIAIALHSLGDGINSTARQPVFNRPEDAEGFLRSRAAVGDENGVDADDETRRRQREELMYWNALLAEKKEKEERHRNDGTGAGQPTSAQGTNFDDFLREDGSAEKGTYVFNTGADVRNDGNGIVRRRAPDGVRGLNAAVYANPFGDENCIDLDDHPVMQANILSPGKDDMSDIYNATERGEPLAPASATLSPHPVPEVLFDMGSSADPNANANGPAATVPLLERALGQDEYVTAGQDDRTYEHDDAYASIQAWAQNSTPGFYSPLPVSPPQPLSEPEIISEGALTPTDSASVADSGEDVGHDAASSATGDGVRYYDVISDDEEGLATPASWSEVGSVVSETEGAVPA